MSRYYANYGQYLGAQRCCDLRGQGPQGPAGPTGASAIGQRGYTGPTGAGPTGATGPLGPTGANGSMTSMIGGLVMGPSTNASSYFGAYAGSFTLNSSLIEQEAITIIPFNSTLSNLYINLSLAPGVGNGYLFTIRNTGTDTGINITISNANNSGSNTINTSDFNAGDQLTIRCDPIGNPALVSVRWSCKITSRI
jgi:hypothetical protein